MLTEQIEMRERLLKCLPTFKQQTAFRSQLDSITSCGNQTLYILSLIS